MNKNPHENQIGQVSKTAVCSGVWWGAVCFGHASPQRNPNIH